MLISAAVFELSRKSGRGQNVPHPQRGAGLAIEKILVAFAIFLCEQSHLAAGLDVFLAHEAPKHSVILFKARAVRRG